jgi:hypothetical protein
MRAIVAIVKGIAVVSSVWIGYNMLVFAEIAAGKKMGYIPYLNFPIKAFLVLIS